MSDKLSATTPAQRLIDPLRLRGQQFLDNPALQDVLRGFSGMASFANDAMQAQPAVGGMESSIAKDAPMLAGLVPFFKRIGKSVVRNPELAEAEANNIVRTKLGPGTEKWPQGIDPYAKGSASALRGKGEEVGSFLSKGSNPVVVKRLPGVKGAFEGGASFEAYAGEKMVADVQLKPIEGTDRFTALVETRPDMRHQGMMTGLMKTIERLGYKIEHGDFTDEGAAWYKSYKGQR